MQAMLPRKQLYEAKQMPTKSLALKERVREGGMARP